MSKPNGTARQRSDDLRVRSDDRPGWVSALERRPTLGEEVFCAGGVGVVKSISGKTGDGSPLLEIHLEDPKAKPFYAAASNVLVAPPGAK